MRDEAKAKFVNDLLNAVGDRAEMQGLETLSDPERTALHAWWGKAIVDNGGLYYFYEGAWRGAEVAEALDAVGFPDAAQAFRRSLDIFPNRHPPINLDLRRAWMDEHDAEVRAFWYPLDDPILRVGDQMYDALEAYIKAHASEFHDLKSEGQPQGPDSAVN